jgi:hypothetical protein
MNTRLKLAKNLLSENGVIFISIDDTEQAHLKILCDEIFGEDNFVGKMVRASSPAQNIANFISIMHDYTFVYCKNKGVNSGNWSVKKNNADEYQKRADDLIKRNLSEQDIEKELKELVKYPRFFDFDHYYQCDAKGVYQTVSMGGVKKGNTKTELIHPKTQKKVKQPQGGWRYKEEELLKLVANNEVYFGENEMVIPRKKLYLNDYLEQIPKGIGFYDTQADVRFLKDNKLDFDFPKPLEYIKYLASMIQNKNAVILDFFAGSGTTGHAVLELNKQDDGGRQFILCTNNENGICEEVTYPRIKKVIEGYGNAEGIPANLRYFKTDFVNSNGLANLSDQDKEILTRNAGEMIALKENCFEQKELNDWWQIFENSEKIAAIYFKESKQQISNLLKKLKSQNKKCSLYIFSWAKGKYKEYESKNIKVEDIPEPILEIYKEINKKEK